MMTLPQTLKLNNEAAEKEEKPSYRFTLDLKQSDVNSFSEFNFKDLLSKQVKNDPKKSKLLGFGDDSNDDVEAMARKLEEKYGGSYGSKKGAATDFVDIGYGYDDSDTFIDNAEAYDEVVPTDWTTELGGFYINQGHLDFKPIENTNIGIVEEVHKKKKKKKTVDKDKLLKTPKDIGTNKKNKIITKDKQRKNSLLKATKILVKKKKKPLPIIDDTSQDTVPLAELNKSLEDDVPLAKIAKACTDESNASTKVQSHADENVPLAKIIATTVTVSKILSAATPKSIGSTSGSNTPQNTTPTMTKPSDSTKTTTPKVFCSLPDGLSQDLLTDIGDLKKLSELSVRGRFFNPEVNKVLLRFAKKCRQKSPKLRNAVYDHILYYLPCAKDTLVKRCRGLVVQHQRDLEDEPMKLLKEAIEASMPKQKEMYDTDLANALQEQAREQIKQTGVEPTKQDATDENPNAGEDKNKKITLPKKKYVWCDKVRNLLCGVTKVRVGLFKMSKNRSMTAEEYIKDFLESEIRVMWPKGWMTSRILYRESRSAHQEITQPSKGKKTTKVETNDSKNNVATSHETKEVINTPISPSKKIVAVTRNPTTTASVNKVAVSTSTTTKTTPVAVSNTKRTVFTTIMNTKSPTSTINSKSKNIVVIGSSPTTKVLMQSQNQSKVVYTIAGNTIHMHTSTNTIPNASINQLQNSAHKLTTSPKVITDAETIEQANAFLKTIGSSATVKGPKQISIQPSFVKVQTKAFPITTQKITTKRTTLDSLGKTSRVERVAYNTPSTPGAIFDLTELDRMVVSSSSSYYPDLKTSTQRKSISSPVLNIPSFPTTLTTPQNINSVYTPNVIPTPLNSSFDGSPKLSPYLTTTPSSKTGVAAHKIYEQRGRQVKRKTLSSDSEDETSSKKVVSSNILDYSSPPKTNKERSWSEMEHDLARISRAATVRGNTGNMQHTISPTLSSTTHHKTQQQITNISPSSHLHYQKIHQKPISNVHTLHTPTMPLKTHQVKTASKQPCAYANQESRSITNTLHKSTPTPSFHKASLLQPNIQQTSIQINSTDSFNTQVMGTKTPSTSIAQNKHQVRLSHSPIGTNSLTPQLAKTSPHGQTSGVHSATLQSSQSRPPFNLASIQSTMAQQINKQPQLGRRLSGTSPLNSASPLVKSCMNTISPKLNEKPLEFHIPQHPAMRLHQATETHATSQKYGHVHAVDPHSGTSEIISAPNLHSSHPTRKLMSELNRSVPQNTHGLQPTLGLSQISSGHSCMRDTQSMLHQTSIGMEAHQIGQQRHTPKKLTAEEQMRMEQLQNEVMMRSKADYQKGYAEYGSTFSS